MRNQQIQSLKGIAALVVFLSHSLQQFPSEVIAWLQGNGLRFFFDGQISVVVFMTLGGYFYINYKSLSIRGYMGGVKKKAERIYVPYIIITLLVWLALIVFPSTDAERYTSWASEFWVEPVSLKQLLKQMSIIFMGDSHLLNPPVWYLRWEVKMFLLMPLIVGLFRKCKYWSLLLIMPVCFLKMSYMAVYVLGMLAHHLLNSCQSNISSWLNRKYNPGLIILSAILLLDVVNIFQLHSLNKWSQELIYIIQGIGASLLICVVISCPLKALKNKITVFFGNISYEFYLVHFAVLMVMRRWFDGTPAFVISTLFISTVLAFLLNRVCDKIIDKLRSIKSI